MEFPNPSIIFLCIAETSVGGFRGPKWVKCSVGNSLLSDRLFRNWKMRTNRRFCSLQSPEKVGRAALFLRLVNERGKTSNPPKMTFSFFFLLNNYKKTKPCVVFFDCWRTKDAKQKRRKCLILPVLSYLWRKLPGITRKQGRYMWKTSMPDRALVNLWSRKTFNSVQKHRWTMRLRNYSIPGQVSLLIKQFVLFVTRIHEHATSWLF